MTKSRAVQQILDAREDVDTVMQTIASELVALLTAKKGTVAGAATAVQEVQAEQAAIATKYVETGELAEWGAFVTKINAAITKVKEAFGS